MRPRGSCTVSADDMAGSLSFIDIVDVAFSCSTRRITVCTRNEQDSIYHLDESPLQGSDALTTLDLVLDHSVFR